MRRVPTKLAVKLYGAAELIADKGIADAKIDEIAEASGIPIATLYYYFRGKEDILAFLLGDLLENIAGEVGTAIAQPGTARERLRGAVEAQMRVMLDSPATCRALVGDLGRATRLPELATALDTAFHQPVAQLLLEGVEDGSLREVTDPEKVALSIFGAVTMPALSAAVIQPQHSSTYVSDTVDAVCDLIIDGLGFTRP